MRFHIPTSTPPGFSPPPTQALETQLGRLLQGVLWVGILLMAAGAARELMVHGVLSRETAPLGEIPARLLALRGSGLLTLGILVFLVSPAAGLLYVVTGLFRAGDRVYALVTLVVLAIVLSGMILSRS